MQSTEAVVREKSTVPKKVFLTIIVVIFVGVVGYLTYAWWRVVSLPEQVVATPLESYGFNEAPVRAEQPLGEILYSVDEIPVGEGEGQSISRVYMYDLRNDTKSLLSIVPMTAVALDNAGKQIVLASTEPSNSYSGAVQPHDFDPATENITLLPNQNGYNVRDLSVSPDGTKYAYSYQTEEFPSPDFGSIDDWNIAVHTRGSADILVIPGSAEPEWGNSNDKIVFMRLDGLYEQKIVDGSLTKLTDLYTPYTLFDDIGVSSSGEHVVLTKIAPNLISVMNLAGENSGKSILAEKSRIVSEDTRFSSPVFSPDGSAYSVFASTLTFSNNAAGDMQSVRRSRVELRNIASNAVYNELPIGRGTDSQSLVLHNWIK